MEQNLSLSKEEGDCTEDLSPYQRLVGRLIYMTITRSDLVMPFTFSINLWTRLEFHMLKRHNEFYARSRIHLDNLFFSHLQVHCNRIFFVMRIGLDVEIL